MSVWIKRSAWVCAAVAVASASACSSSSVNDSELFASDSGTLGSGGNKDAGSGGASSGGTGGGESDASGASGGSGGSAGTENPGGGGASGGGGPGIEDAGGDASGGGGSAGAAGAATGGAGGETGGAGGGGGTGGACVPATCPAGLCNTSFPDGCGGVVTCGGCGSNAFACIANSCQLIVTSACGSCPGNLSVLAQIAGSDDCNCGGGGVMCGNLAYVVAHGFNITCSGSSKFANSVYDCSTSQTYSVCVQ